MQTARGNDDDERDDVDARFAALIRDDFGTDVGPARARPERRPLSPPPDGTRRPAVEIPDERPRGPRDVEVGVFDAWDRADDELDQREGTEYRPRPLPPMRRWSALASVGTLLTVLGLLTALAGIAIQLPGWATTLAVLGLCVGLSALIVSALRRRGDRDHLDRDENGAVV